MSAVTSPLKPTRDPIRRGRHLQVVGEALPRHTVPYVLLMLVVLGAAVLGTVSLNALAAGHSMQTRALEREVEQAELRYAQLVAEVAALEDPGRIRAAARELGLVPATEGRHLPLARLLPADGAVGLGGEEVHADPLKPVLSVER